MSRSALDNEYGSRTSDYSNTVLYGYFKRAINSGGRLLRLAKTLLCPKSVYASLNLSMMRS